jgi:hypothetical protein
MNRISFPTQSMRTIIKSTIVAIGVASVVSTTIIPAAEEGAEKGIAARKDEATVVVPAGGGIEYKFRMNQYAKLVYEWKTDGAPLYYDFHGEPKGDSTGYFESYAIATNAGVKGSVTVPFDGVHGWYWKNTADQDVTVTLKTEGMYEVIGNPKH